MTPDAFRAVFSEVPSAVAVLTAMAGGEPRGITVTSFCSFAAEPPLVLIAMNKASSTLEALEASGRFGLNVLAAGQEAVAETCARKGSGKFADVSWRLDHGLPRIDGASAWLACELQSSHAAATHLAVIGLVEDGASTGADPLVHWRRTFVRV